MTCLKKPSTIFLTSGCSSGRASLLRRGVTWRNEARRFCFHVRRARSSVLGPDWPSVSGVGGPSLMAYPCSSSSAASSDDSDLNDAPSACSFDSLQQDGGVGWGWAWRALVTGCEQGGCGTGWYLFGLLGIDPSVRASALRGASGGGDRGGDGGGDRLMRRAGLTLRAVLATVCCPSRYAAETPRWHSSTARQKSAPICEDGDETTRSACVPWRRDLLLVAGGRHHLALQAHRPLDRPMLRRQRRQRPPKLQTPRSTSADGPAPLRSPPEPSP